MSSIEICSPGLHLILDHGLVRLVGHMGSDLSIVCADLSSDAADWCHCERV
jgi:hypothetical protein